MIKTIAVASVILFGGIFILGTMQSVAVAQKASVPHTQDKVALGQQEVEQLVLLIAGDKTGKITKDQWMKFMEAEFDRLDKNKTGELDAKELTLSRLRVSRFSDLGR